MSQEQQFTRATRTVRVTSKNGNYFADVEILMAVALLLPNGFEIAYNVSKAINPTIIDNTGYNLGRPGGPDSTRTSHIEIVNGKPDGPAKTQYFAIEICDAFMVVGPNNAEHLISCPSANATPSVVDSVGAGLTQSPPGNTQTRCQHVVKYTQQMPGADPADNPANYAYGLITDCITFDGPPFGMPFVTESPPGTSSDIPVGSETSDAIWQDQFGLVFENPDRVLHGALQPNAKCHDLTDYTTDPITGEQVPPPPGAGDLNVYVYFPDASGGPFLGDATLPNPPDGNGNILPTPGYNGIDMGPLWWIRQLGSTNNVWYWYASPVQQPLVWSFFGPCPNSPFSGNWGYEGYLLLPDTPVVWILSDGAHGNYPLYPIGTTGCATLEQAAEGSGGGGLPTTTSWLGVAIPDGGFGCATTSTQVGAFGSGLPILAFSTDDSFFPFGALPLTDPPSSVVLAEAKALGEGAAYSEFGGPAPNIWELTGISQPPLRNPALPYNASTNPYQQPSNELAQQVCQTFAQMWNATTDACNSAMASGVGKPGGQQKLGPANTQPPGWAFKVPYPGGTTASALGFHCNILPFMMGGGVPPGVWYPATLQTIAVGQLNPSVWNNAPANFPQSGPVKWSWGNVTSQQTATGPNLQTVGLFGL